MGWWPKVPSGAGRRSALVAVVLSGATALTACGSSSASSHPSAATAAQLCCRGVPAAVLGNGPDVSEDPVGYAEAQILPLRAVSTSDTALHRAVLDLSAAYRAYFRTGGSAAAKAAIRHASAQVDAVCPGATS
jgi:hypothetical protein